MMSRDITLKRAAWLKELIAVFYSDSNRMILVLLRSPALVLLLRPYMTFYDECKQQINWKKVKESNGKCECGFV